MASSSSPQILGLSPFQFALAFETLANIVTVPLLLFYPQTSLGMILSNPARDIRQGSELMSQLFGGLVVALTVPLVMSMPSPNSFATTKAADRQRGIRVASYYLLGAGEIMFAAIFGAKLLAANAGEDVGMTKTSALMCMSTMLSILPMRALFLFVRRDWLEEDEQGFGAVGGGRGKKEL